MFLTSLSGALVAFIFITALSGSFASSKHTPTGVAMIPFLFFFNAFYAIAFTPIPLLYVPEISPFSLRAKSAALLLLSQNVAQAFNQFVNPVALRAIAWRYFIVYVGIIAFYLIVFYLFCRETKGLTVEEAALVYEPERIRDAALELDPGQLEAAADDHDDKLTLELKDEVKHQELKGV